MKPNTNFPLTYTDEQVLSGEYLSDPRVAASALQFHRRQGFGIYFGLSDSHGNHVVMHETESFRLVDKWRQGISMPRQFSLQVRDEHDNLVSISLTAAQVDQLREALS